MTTKYFPVFKIAIVFGFMTITLAAQEPFEKNPTLKASDVVPRTILKGSLHEIADDVETDGLWHAYTVRSSLGDFTVHGSFLLRQRIHELYALAELRKVNEAAVAVQGAEESLVDTGKTLIQVGTHPQETVEGIIPGIQRLYDRMHRNATEGMKSPKTNESRESGGEPALLKIAEGAIGVTDAERMWAKRYGIDPYTLNPQLRAEIKKLAVIETGGRLSASTFVPLPQALTAVARVGHIVWDSDPDELKMKNRGMLEHFGLPESEIYSFENNPHYGLTRQTELINNLATILNANGRREFIERAAMADSEALAVYFVECSRLFARFNDEVEPVTDLLTTSETVMPALRTPARIVFVLPVDYIVWTEYIAGRITEAADGLHRSYPQASKELWITGAASERTLAELAALGISLREMVFPTQLAPVSRLEEPPLAEADKNEEGIRFGGKYRTLAAEQRRLIDSWYDTFNRITGERRDPQSYYDKVPLSARTTFEAVTHALLNTNLTTVDGRLLGRAIDLIHVIEAVRGQIPKSRGDMQFRIYAVLKPGATDLLEESVEFSRRHDNTVYHKDYPINYRLDKTPSIQFSITRTLERADIDVDYRSSTFPWVLFDGHLTAANSDVRAGNNFEHHVGRWSGFGSWWRSLFGLIFPAKVPEKFETVINIPAKPAVTDSENLDAAVHDFLQTWLVDRKPEKAIPYFSPAAYDCVLELHGKKDSKSEDLAAYRLLHEMQQTNHFLGSPNDMRGVIRPVYSTNRDLVISPHRYTREFAYYNLPGDIADLYTCPAPEGYRTVPLSESGEEHIGVFSEIMGPFGKSEELVTVWRKESGFWKIVSFHIGTEIHHANLPDHRSPEPESKSPIHVNPDPGAVRTLNDFLTTWFVQRDYPKAESFFSDHCHDCTNTMSDRDQPIRTREEAVGYIGASIRQIAASVPVSSSLKDMITGVESWHTDVHVVDHPDREAYLLASVPDSIAEPLACKVRTPHAGIHADLPPHEKDLYLSAFHLNNNLEQPPVLFLLWAKEASQWRIVSYHVELH